MKKAKIAVFVSGGGTNLQALIDAQKAANIPHGEIVLVLSSEKTAFALDRAKNAGIPAYAVNRKDAENQTEFEDKLRMYLKKYSVDLIILAGFLNILSEDFTAEWPKRIINIHPSLIPSFCGRGMYGLKVHKAALEKGVKITGATVHFVNEVADGGEIIMQKPVRIRKADTAETLQKRVMEQAEWILLPKAAELVCSEIVKQKEKNHD